MKPSRPSGGLQWAVVTVVVALLSLLMGDASAQQIDADVLGTSSTSASSTNFRLAAMALGQPVAGSAVVGTSVRLWSGVQLAGGRGVDSDADGLSDANEAALSTNVRSADSDADGLSDFLEVNFDGDPGSYLAGTDTDPLNPDTDGDGLLDGADPDPLNGSVTSVKVPLLPLPALLALALLLPWMARRVRSGDR